MKEDLIHIMFEKWLTPLAFAVAVWWIIGKLKQIDRHAKRRDNSAKMTEIKVDAIAFAMGNQPHPIGKDFKDLYDKMVSDRLREENFIDQHNKI